MAEPTKTRPGDQPLPTAGRECVQDSLIKLIEERKALGVERYGSALMTHNVRDSVRDALEEALDLTVYLMQVDMEMRDLRATVAAYENHDAGEPANPNGFVDLRALATEGLLAQIKEDVHQQHLDRLEAATAGLQANLRAVVAGFAPPETKPAPGLRDQVAAALEARVKAAVLPDPLLSLGAVGTAHYIGASFHDLADVVLAVPGLTDALARLAAYEMAITWNVSCTGCARLLDASITDHDRAEQAEDVAREILAEFSITAHPGDRKMSTWVPESRIAAWRAVLDGPNPPVDHQTYVNGDDSYMTLRCGRCEGVLMEVDAGTHLTEINAADARHNCPPPADCGEED